MKIGAYHGQIYVSVWQTDERKGQTVETNSKTVKALFSETAADGIIGIIF